jgi:hypothetical protein
MLEIRHQNKATSNGRKWRQNYQTEQNKTYISEYTFSPCDPPESSAGAAFSVLSDDFFFQGQLRRSISGW